MEIEKQKKKRKVNRLYDLEISEISLVDSGAVSLPGLGPGKNIFLYKRLVNNSVPDSLDNLTPEQEKELNEKFNALDDDQKLEILKQLAEIATSLDEPEEEDPLLAEMKAKVSKIQDAILKLKEQDPDAYVRFCKDEGEGWQIDDKYETITQKPKPPELRKAYYDEDLGRWVIRYYNETTGRYEKRLKGWRKKRDEFGRDFWTREGN